MMTSSFIALPFAIKMMLSYALVRQILPCRTGIYTDTPIKVIHLGCKIYLLYKEAPGNTALYEKVAAGMLCIPLTGQMAVKVILILLQPSQIPAGYMIATVT